MSVVACALMIGAIACSDDKTEHPPAAAQSSGDESTAERVKRRANEVHGNFKEEIRPAAEWVDEKSHRVADEVRTAVHKADNAISGDDQAPAKPAGAEPAKPAGAEPANPAGTEPVKPAPAATLAPAKPAAAPSAVEPVQPVKPE